MAVLKHRDGAPPLSDVPGMMRHVADLIDSGQVEAKSAICIIPQADGTLKVFGWGDHLGRYGNIAVCEMAKAWFVSQTS